MNKSDRIRLQHMLEAAEEAYSLAHAHSRDALDSERLLMLALIRLVEVVGEAANQISDTLQQGHSDIPWRDIVGMRNRLIHAYFDINLDILWQTVTEELPPLIQQLKTLLAQNE